MARDPIYSVIVTTSTSLSVAWHWYGEPAGLLLYADYSVAAIWSLYSLLLIENKHLPLLLCLEGGTFVTNLFVSNMCGPEWYRVAHSIWHIVSAAKCIWVAWLFRQRQNTGLKAWKIPIIKC